VRSLDLIVSIHGPIIKLFTDPDIRIKTLKSRNFDRNNRFSELTSSSNSNRSDSAPAAAAAAVVAAAVNDGDNKRGNNTQEEKKARAGRDADDHNVGDHNSDIARTVALGGSAAVPLGNRNDDDDDDNNDRSGGIELDNL
jgi:hypothetical protein